MSRQQPDELSTWKFQKWVYDGLAQRPGLFTMQETALLLFIQHKQYVQDGYTRPLDLDQVGAMWGVTGEYLRQLLVRLERKRGVVRPDLEKYPRGVRQRYGATFRLAFETADATAHAPSDHGDFPTGVGDFPTGVGDFPTGVGLSTLDPRARDLSFDLLDHVQEATAPAAAAPATDENTTAKNDDLRPHAGLFDEMPQPATPAPGAKHAKAHKAVVQQLRRRVQNLCREVLKTPDLAVRLNCEPLPTHDDDGVALEFCVKRLCQERGVEEWPRYLATIIRPTVRSEWFKRSDYGRKVIRGEAARPRDRGHR